MSPVTNNASLGWPQPSVPMLHLPGSNLQSSRLRSSLSARDMPVNDLSLILDLDAQHLDDNCFSPRQARLGPFGGNGNGNGNHTVRPMTLNPSNLDGLFSAEISSSPRYNADQGALFSPSHKAALLNQLHYHQQQHSLLSPINTSVFSPRAVDPHQHPSLFPASLGISSPGRMSPRSLEQLSPFSTQLAALAQREKLQHLRSLGSRDLGCGIGTVTPTPANPSLSKWGSPTGKLDWGVNGEELDRLKRSSSPFELGSGGEDVSWVQPLVTTPEMEETTSVGADGGLRTNSNVAIEGHAVINAWLEQMQLDPAAAADQ